MDQANTIGVHKMYQTVICFPSPSATLAMFGSRNFMSRPIILMLHFYSAFIYCEAFLSHLNVILTPSYAISGAGPEYMGQFLGGRCEGCCLIPSTLSPTIIVYFLILCHQCTWHFTEKKTGGVLTPKTLQI